MQKSIVADVLHKQLPVLVEQSDRVVKDSKRLQTSLNDMQRGMSRIEERASQAQISLRTQVTRYFQDLILKLDGTSMETFKDFYDRDIGDDGVLIETKIQNMFQQEIGSIVHDLKNINAKLEEEVGLFEGVVMGYGKQGLDLLRKSGLINSQNVLLARDALVSAGKIVGLDLAKALKFKPWGAVNFASKINVFLAAAGIVFELLDSYKKAQKEKEFQEMKDGMRKHFNAQRKELLDLINGKGSNTTQGFIEQFFPQMLIMQEQYNHIVQAMNEIEGKKQKINQWREEGEIIDAEFRDLD